MGIRFRATVAELLLATHVRAFGAWWQAKALRRLGKFSGGCSAPLKTGDEAQSETAGAALPAPRGPESRVSHV